MVKELCPANVFIATKPEDILRHAGSIHALIGSASPLLEMIMVESGNPIEIKVTMNLIDD